MLGGGDFRYRVVPGWGQLGAARRTGAANSRASCATAKGV